MTSAVRPALLAVLAAALLLPAIAAGHELFDHAPPTVSGGSGPRAVTSQAPAGAWEFVSSITTGNPHSDLDFFTRGGETYASVGTLGAGPNGGGQTIIQLTQNGGQVQPRFVGSHPSASCVTNEAEALGLQHDVESAPKGTTLLNTANPFADRSDTQIIVDATDSIGRCHDSTTFGTGANDAQGGLEIVDVTNPADPVEIGMTSHIGEAHTVNIDPKRPHIAYAVTSDAISVSNGRRTNATGGFALDGFEVVDMSSCMNFPPGTSVAEKRRRCRPQVFRYRYPQLAMVQGTVNRGTVYGCHELEIYPNDRLTCGSGSALMVFDMAGAFDDNGTPNDFRDDRPRGTPLPCRVRASSTVTPGFGTGAQVVDCVDGTGEGTNDLIVANWLQDGAPSLAGVRYLGSAFHMGRESATGAVTPSFPPTEDVDFNHEAEYSHSGNLLIATDERGGGVLPPGASCDQADANGGAGNGGVHFYRADRLLQATPPLVRTASGSVDEQRTAEQAWVSYARTPQGGKAIFRARIRTGAQATICTAHVFQQIPGQNRIFMGWYSQGTQVIDFTENPDGTVTTREAGHFIPGGANQWVSAIFKVQENPDGSFTYWGATGDFRISEGGRNSIDIYRVTLPAPPRPAPGPGVIERERSAAGAATTPASAQPAATGPGTPTCVDDPALRSVRVRGDGRRLAFAFSSRAPVTVDLFRQSRGRRITGEQLYVRFRDRTRAFRWSAVRGRSGRAVGDGVYVARFTVRPRGAASEVRRIALERRGGRWRVLPAYARRDGCGTLRTFKLERPVFGGRSNLALLTAFRLDADARVTVTVRRAGGDVVRRIGPRTYRGGVPHRVRVSVGQRFPRGDYRVQLSITRDGQTTTETLTARRL